jgi:hypothetical protein
MACLSYGSTEQYDFQDYILRYANDQYAPIHTYEYGRHDEDCIEIKETHQERMAR